MSTNSAFEEIQKEDIPLLLDELERDLPDSAHVLVLLKTLLRVKESEPDTEEVRILALNGNFRHKMILLYWLTSGIKGLHIRGSAHKWSHRDDDDPVMMEALVRTKNVPWSVKLREMAILSPETSRVVHPILPQLWGGCKIYEQVWDLYWLPKQEALEFPDGDIPDGAVLSPLSPSHAQEIFDTWPSNGVDEVDIRSSFNRFTLELKHNVALGLFDRETGELMSWCVQTMEGDPYLLTKPHHARKGYGKLLYKAVAKEMAKRGFHICDLLLQDNLKSYRFLDQMRSQFLFTSKWLQNLPFS